MRINTVSPGTCNSHPLNQFVTGSIRVPSLSPLISGSFTLHSRTAALHIIISKHNRANWTSRKLLPKYISYLVHTIGKLSLMEKGPRSHTKSLMHNNDIMHSRKTNSPIEGLYIRGLCCYKMFVTLFCWAVFGGTSSLSDRVSTKSKRLAGWEIGMDGIKVRGVNRTEKCV